MNTVRADQVLPNRERIIKELLNTERPGVDKLVDWLKQADYFTAPASRDNHLACIGGLAQHSINVMELLRDKVDVFGIDASDSSVVICSLLHDLCKVNFYTEGFRNVKVGPGPKDWERQRCWDIKDQFPLGHGGKSLYLARLYIDINDVEAMAITWHMGPFDGGYGAEQQYKAACKYHALVPLLHSADYEAAHIMERGEDANAVPTA